MEPILSPQKLAVVVESLDDQPLGYRVSSGALVLPGNLFPHVGQTAGNDYANRKTIFRRFQVIWAAGSALKRAVVVGVAVTPAVTSRLALSG